MTQTFKDMEQLQQWLNQFSHPHLIEQWASVKNMVRVTADGTFNIEIPFADAELNLRLTEWLETQKEAGQYPDGIQFSVSTKVATLAVHGTPAVKGIKNIIAISSAKGGVGKSTTAVNLALALELQGAKVGMLDADIYGPSVPMMLDAEELKPQPAKSEKGMHPVEAYGLYTNSIGYLVPADNATVWRGPMASKALHQMLSETIWPDLDYLIIDMPPGTGDIQLTLSQNIPVTSAVVITTPQDLALADAIKGVTMFDKVEVPVLGVVENMSYHICSHCGHQEAIFGTGGAIKMAKAMDLPLLAQLPLDIQIRSDIDARQPTVIAAPESEASLHYLGLAATIAARLYWQGEVVADQISFTAV
ncbi:iron-sulfur cluster carrier protein ApbC [Vibrio sp. SS-MA-C1-2]|uniref:iron-sulfur cluster carrier protein ApbC n=1 Tax=Vibrio sp. SS-MA-C1-2 TaxID=2908646 RepID=UPI001F24C105|nr:iron-sulfur cluster carrier protein ApbC [Vibrio sp. SS-MA-C1-2]UJF19904.1 iron-sulfur cluster carrier protein ApbC [Vibrio sp. SS-MA-C1-2]